MESWRGIGTAVVQKQQQQEQQERQQQQNEHRLIHELQDMTPQVQKQINLARLCDSVPLRARSYNSWLPLEEGVTITWSDLTVYAKSKRSGRTICKQIISGVNGAVKAGSLVAIMGASGAGKSTFMSTLAYRHCASVCVEGDILINGRPIGPYMKWLSGFMYQDDAFVGSLTVTEHLHIMANLKLDRRTRPDERKRIIGQLVAQLGLNKCANTRIGRPGENKVLSGGERKRLAFATELLTDPIVLFCDEPTTGLDSYSAQKLVEIMNVMVAAGKTVLCTIHQPSSNVFAMFSQLILMAEGKIAFMGSAANATEFFNELGYRCPRSFNPAEYLIKTLAVAPGFEDSSRQTIKKVCNHFAVSDYYKEVDVVVQYELHMGRAMDMKPLSKKSLQNNFKPPFWTTKLVWLTWRWFSSVLRDPNIQFTSSVQKIIIAIMVGLCYLGTDMYTQLGVQSVQGALFMLVTENTFSAMYSVLAEFPQNTHIFLREQKSGLYGPATYYLSRVIAMTPGLVLDSVLFVVIVYFMSGLKRTMYAVGVTILSTVLTIQVSTACGIFFSNAFESVPAAMAYLVPFDHVLLITSGLLIKLDTLPSLMSWTKYLSWLMYANESMSIAQWSGIANISCQNEETSCVRNGDQVLAKYSFAASNLVPDLCSMAALCLLFHVLAFLCLAWKTHKK